MGTRTKKRLICIGMLAACFTAFLFHGCSEKGMGDRLPNIPPDTEISYGPSEDSLTFYRVQAFWYGSDEDGDIDYFEVTTVKSIQRGDTIDFDALDWGRTTSKESTFVVQADSCCYGEPDDGDPHFATSFWGILVRSVDNDGDHDPDPAGLYFQAANLIPRADLRVPAYSPRYQSVRPRPYILWEGSDADGDETQLQYKYLLLPEDDKDGIWGGGVPPLDYEGSGGPHKSPDVGMWSEWVPADCTSVRDIDLSSYRIGSAGEDKVWVYVTSRDEGGAFLPPELFYTYNDGKNVQGVQVLNTGSGVQVVVEGQGMATIHQFQCTTQDKTPPAVFLGAGVTFRIWGEEVPTEGQITEAYRYYFDEPDDPLSRWNFWTSVEPIRDPGSSPQWRVRFPSDGELYPAVGSHVFTVQLRDYNRDTTCCAFHFDVLPGPQGRETNILLVDDNRDKGTEGIWISDFEEQEFELWSNILAGYDWQEWDTGHNYSEETPVRLVGGATTTIWNVDLGASKVPDLLDLCSVRGNYLHSYVKVGGNLIIIGESPTFCTMYWPDGTPDPGNRINVNDIDFSPRVVDTDSTLHFMWEIFGVKRARLSQFPIYYVDRLIPCEPYLDWNTVPVAEPKTHHVKWKGYISGPFQFPEFRPGSDVHPLYGVRRVEYPWSPESLKVYTDDCENIGGVYVEGGSQRGHAAIINLPAFWLDHEELTIVIRRLLESFGEYPQEE